MKQTDVSFKFTLRCKDAALDADPAVRAWLKKCERLIRKDLEFQRRWAEAEDDARRKREN